MRWFFLFLPIFLYSCESENERYGDGFDFDDAMSNLNNFVKNWNVNQLREANEELASAEPGSLAAKDAVKKVARFERRIALGDYFSFKTPADLPFSLQWKNGLDEPEDSDPAAKKGGVFRYFVSSFPPTLRPFGPASNSGMRGELYDDVQLGLVALNRLNS